MISTPFSFSILIIMFRHLVSAVDLCWRPYPVMEAYI
jgi:hypothetical protein